ncbi:pyruvate kinase II [Gammaproteobacteria bacterium]
MRRTKIVSTLGPASSSLDVLRKMIAAGVDVVRLNFSHGTPDEKKSLVTIVRQAAKEEGKIVGILADLQGPKIRVAKFKNGKVFLKENAEFVLDAALAKDAGDENVVGIDYKELPHDVKPEDVLLLDDGRLVLVVKKIEGTRIICRVQVGGDLSNNKGINRQGGGLSAGALTDKDREDLRTAVLLNADYVAISFVRSKADVEETKALIAKEGGNAGVIAKIERIEAMVPDVLKEIIKSSDGIMVARGDLGVEIGDAEVPAAQKFMIDCAVALNKPVITATQMMETMIHNATPTRAEVSDVANAVLDGTDAVMLSAETATGDHPVLVIQTIDRVCLAAEKNQATLVAKYRLDLHFERADEAIAMSSMYVANNLNIKAIIALTETGKTTLWMSRVHSGIPIYGLSRSGNTLGRMVLYRDVYPIEFDVTKFKTNIEIKAAAIDVLKKADLIKNDDLVAVACGDHIGVAGGTNSLTILQVV